jgi:nucleotide-binding universal stress UspA family protein
MTFGIFAPIFFAAAGLKVNILNLMEPRLFGIAVIMILVAIFSKVVGAYAGARLVGNSSHWTALSLGFGLNARGAIQIIVANIGLSLGILTQDTFSMIILMAMVTSLITPFTVRWALRHVQPEAQELERLRYEALVKDNFIAKIHRVLLPVRRREQNNNRAIQIIEAQILEKLSLKTELAITLLSVASQNDKMESIEFLNQTAEGFSQPNLTKKVVESQKPIEVILTEAQKDYDLLIMGSSETNRRGILFTPLVDDLVRLSPCPSIVVKGPRELTADWLPKRILVPSNGSMASKRAGEVAFALAGDTDEEVHILQVIERRKNDLLLEADEDVYQRRVTIARQIVDELGAVGESLGVKTKPVVEFGPDPETVILNQAQENNVDLIVIGTGVRPGSSDLYLGPRVEYILNNAPCPVIVVNSG